MTTPAEAVKPIEPPPSPAAPPSVRAVARGIVRVARPRQWLKNVLVFVAPGAAGVLLHAHVLTQTLGAFAIFCLGASGTYFLNDAADVRADRSHPTKRHRPIAAGIVPVPLALAIAVPSMAGAVGLAWALAGWRLALVMGIYCLVNVAYSLELKNEPVLDLAAVSSGFVLRAIAGGLAAGVALSNWFIIVASFGSLLIVTGKRSGEQHLLHGAVADQAQVRRTLNLYTPSFLQAVRTAAAAVTITAYCLWAFERAGQAHPGHDPIWFQLTIIPFVIGLLHVVRLLDSGVGSAPEELAIHDHRLQLYGLAWVALFAVGIYVA
ncbi:MAG: decaprenyl-phosphate phosphoribosyltransferase [Actinomycetota bacterium]|nr:decaprenyl-phosphate phosphoribosyltransferase [Actinomycetota bacterium]